MAEERNLEKRLWRNEWMVGDFSVGIVWRELPGLSPAIVIRKAVQFSSCYLEAKKRHISIAENLLQLRDSFAHGFK